MYLNDYDNIKKELEDRPVKKSKSILMAFNILFGKSCKIFGITTKIKVLAIIRKIITKNSIILKNLRHK